MKNFKMILLAALLGGVTLFAGQAELRLPRTNVRAGSSYKQASKIDVLKVVPHLAASNDWKSVLIIRNDQDTSINLGIDFYGADGDPASVVFYDSDDVSYEGSQFDFSLVAFEVYTIEFDHMVDSGLFNLSAFIFSSEEEQFYSVESIFSNFQGQDKVASVGGGLPIPGDNFFLNVDERLDPYTHNKKLRGLAVENIETQSCNCIVTLWDHLGVNRDTVNVTIQPQAKWLGALTSLVDTTKLPHGLGVLDFDCNRLVSVVGLSFEAGTPIVGGTPIDYYTYENGKKQVRAK